MITLGITRNFSNSSVWRFSIVIGCGSSGNGRGSVELKHVAINDHWTGKFNHVADVVVGLGVILIVIIDIACAIANDEASRALGDDGALYGVSASSGDVWDVVNHVGVAVLGYSDILGNVIITVSVSKGNGGCASCSGIVGRAGEWDSSANGSKGEPTSCGSCTQRATAHRIADGVGDWTWSGVIVDVNVFGWNWRRVATAFFV